MPYAEVETPIPGPAAFGATGDAATLSRAAVLLLLGAQLRGDDYALYGRAGASGLEPYTEAIPADDLAVFPVPRVATGGERIPAVRARRAIATRYGYGVLPEPAGAAAEALAPPSPMAIARPDIEADLAQRVYREPSPMNAAQLFELFLHHGDGLLRVAAAAAYFRLSAEPARLLRVLEDGTIAADDLVREVAATALARVAPDHPRLAELSRATPPPRPGVPSHTSLLVHGTFARGSAWWQPGGDFHNYVLANVRPDLYGAPDRFEWSGGYSDAARAIGADDLRTWLNQRGINRADLFAHSHGASVAMLASHYDTVNLGELALLSCPVHVDTYLPSFDRVWEVVSIRVHLDLVILVDGGGQRFWHPQIREHVLPLWFDHSATHTPSVWQQHNVAGLL